MKLLVLSDSHTRSDRVRDVVRMHRDAAAILHLGDGYGDLTYADVRDVPVYAVKGNWEDFFSPYPDGVPTERCETFGGFRIFMTHGHRYGGDAERAAVRALSEGADVLLFGHTHIPFDRYLAPGETVGDTVLTKPLWICNPGSIGQPRRGDPSFGLLTLQGQSLLVSHGSLSR